VDYTSVKNTLIQSWSYKTLAVTKRHKNHLSLCLYVDAQIVIKILKKEKTKKF